MIDHISIGVRDLGASARFYEVVLAPLGFKRLVERPAMVGFGKTYPEVWLNARPAMPLVAADTGLHVCLRARSTEAVDAFHRAAIANGGKDDGAPGMRAAAMVAYYGAFICDPDGNRVEAMTVPKSGSDPWV